MIDIPDFVYPTDEQGNQLCPRCRKLVSKCDCPVLEPSKAKVKKITPSIRLEKSGRKGKTVTVIEGLPLDEESLKSISRMLKTKTGSGGTYYLKETGIIEIQGDHKQVIQKILNES